MKSYRISLHSYLMHLMHKIRSILADTYSWTWIKIQWNRDCQRLSYNRFVASICTIFVFKCSIHHSSPHFQRVFIGWSFLDYTIWVSSYRRKLHLITVSNVSARRWEHSKLEKMTNLFHFRRTSSVTWLLGSASEVCDYIFRFQRRSRRLYRI